MHGNPQNIKQVDNMGENSQTRTEGSQYSDCWVLTANLQMTI